MGDTVIAGSGRPAVGSCKGADSAFAPTVPQVRLAITQGILFWAFYVSGAGAFHDWSAAEIDNLRQGGLSLCLPVFVPALVNGRIDPTANPEADAQRFVTAFQAAGVNGVGALDTEASMRGDSWTRQYSDRFFVALRKLNQADVCYEGGFLLGSPSSATFHWWIIDSTAPPAGECYQFGAGTIDGRSVDYDYADAAFPLAIFSHNPTPPDPPAPTEDDVAGASIVIVPAGAEAAIPVPPPHGGGVNGRGYGNVWYSFSRDFDPDVARVYVGSEKGWRLLPGADIDGYVPIQIGRGAVVVGQAGDQIVSVRNDRSKRPVGVLIEWEYA